MSHLHDWRNAPEGLVQEYVQCLKAGDTGRARKIQEKVHAKNKQAKAKNPGAIARLMGFFKTSDDPEKV